MRVKLQCWKKVVPINGLEHLHVARGTRKQLREADRPPDQMHQGGAIPRREALQIQVTPNPPDPNSQPNPANDLPSPTSKASSQSAPLTMQRRIAQGDTTRDRARSGTLARPAARGSCPGEGSGRHGGRVYVEEEGGEVDYLLRRRRPSSCTAAPSPVRPGRRRRGSEACGAGGRRRCCSCSLGRGRTMSPDRFAREEGDPVPVVRAPVRWGSTIRRHGTRRDAGHGFWLVVARPFCTGNLGWVHRVGD